MRPDGETAERGDGAGLEPWSREGVPGWEGGDGKSRCRSGRKGIRDQLPLM